jgi:uncharacterized C2H2 Zn-finger protein
MAELCALCQAEFASPAELVAHTHKVHGADRPAGSEIPNAPEETGSFRCGLCGAVFSRPSELARHNMVPHSPAGPPAEPTAA